MLVAHADLLDMLHVPATDEKYRASAGPAPQELVLSSHLHASSAFTSSQKGTAAEDGVFTPLAAYVMHLIVVGLPSDTWHAPKALEALGPIPSA